MHVASACPADPSIPTVHLPPHLAPQTQDFKIRYTAIQRIFILPKSNTPHTMVVISLDPPIRKGQTYYTHVLCQFPTDDEATVELDITPEQLAAKNEKVRGCMEVLWVGGCAQEGCSASIPYPCSWVVPLQWG